MDLNHLFTWPGWDSDWDSKPGVYIVLCRSFHIGSNPDPYSDGFPNGYCTHFRDRSPSQGQISIPLLLYLPTATKLGQGNVFTGVCDSVNRGCLPQCMLGYPLGADTSPPGVDTPRSRHPLPRPDTPFPRPDTAPGTRHPPGPDTPWTRHPPQEQTPPWDQTLAYSQ